MAQTGENFKLLDDGTVRWEPRPEQDAQIIPLHPENHLVKPGEYQALCIGHRGIDIFRARKVVVWWKLLEHPEILLPRYYRVTSYRPRVCAPSGSDIARDVAAALGRRVRRDQIPVSSLTGIYVRVEVRTVTADREQRKLPEVCTYSVIDRVIGPA